MSVVIPPSTRWCCPISCCDLGTLERSSSYTIDDVNITSSSSSSSSCIPCIPYNVIDTNSNDTNIDIRNCISCDDGCRWICQPNPNHSTQSSQAPVPSSSSAAVVTPSITTSTSTSASTSTSTSTSTAASAAASTINTLIASSSALSTLAEHTLAYVNVHGMCMLTSALHTNQHHHVQERKEGQYDHQVAHLPVTLLPTKMSRSGFSLVNRVAPLINTLMDHIARDSSFLNTHLASCITVDPFQRRLLDIYNRVKNEGNGMDLTLSISRADYMLDGDDMVHAHPLQVEVNTISAGLITLAQRVHELHSFILERHVSSMVDDDINDVEHPPNHSFDGLISAMKLTVDTFHIHHMSSSPKPRLAILFVVQPIEFNISDQRQIEYTLWDKYKIPVYRRTLTQIYDMTLNEQHHLMIDGYTIALVYFRSGYAPSDFPTEKEWDALYMLETAVTVKCPDVGHHLAGTKKIQQVLAQPGVVERFLPASDAALVRSTYTGLYALDNDNPATQSIIADAIAHPHSYVLKPQRNGGGNNFFGIHVANILSTATLQERQQYILMKRIHPVIQLTATIREGQVHVTPCSSELGIFAAHLGSTSTGVLLNTALGYLLRTKKAESDEGGVASGNAVVDSPMLV